MLVIGQGPIGILLAALARRTGATVLTSDLYPERHAIAAKFGLDHPLDARGDVVAAAKAATEGRGADVALVAVGGNALIKVAMDAIRPGGRVMLFAQTQHGEAPFDPAAVCMDEKTLMGSYQLFGGDSTRRSSSWCSMAIGRRSFDLTELISHRFSLEEAVAGDRSGFASAGGLDEDRDSALSFRMTKRTFARGYRKTSRFLLSRMKRAPVRRWVVFSKALLFLVGSAVVLMAASPMAPKLPGSWSPFLVVLWASMGTLALTWVFVRWDGLRLRDVGAAPGGGVLRGFSLDFCWVWYWWQHRR